MKAQTDTPPSQQENSSNVNNNNMSSTLLSTKTIYLVRHAESLENVAYAPARRAIKALGSFRPPSAKDLGHALVLPFQMFRQSVMNAAVSELGERQIQQLHDNFAKDKINNNRHDNLIVVYSPLRRAKQTAFGTTFGSDYLNAETAPESETPFLELESLKEINPQEVVNDTLTFWKEKAIDTRIKEFEAWIETRDEDAIVAVGHSVYFKRMLDLPETFDNCDVWELQYDVSRNQEEANKQEKGDGGKTAVPPGFCGSNQDDSDGPVKTLPRSWMSIKQRFAYTPEQNPEFE